MRQWKIGELFGVKFTVSFWNYGAVNTMCHGNRENHGKMALFLFSPRSSFFIIFTQIAKTTQHTVARTTD